MKGFRACLAGGWMAVGLAFAADPPPSILFATGFEPGEGYTTNDFSLDGRNGWAVYGTGGNGILVRPETFGGLGQQAYIGFFPPTVPTEDTTVVYRPLLVPPGTNETPIVQFRVLMEIVDSSTAQPTRDSFRWALYNTNAQRLFAIDFDNATLDISYDLDDTNGLVFTGKRFENYVRYELMVSMDFVSNRWSALLDGSPLVQQRPITTRGAALNFGDMDAVWFLANVNAPGDNMMIFDNFQVTAHVRPTVVQAPRLESLGWIPGHGHAVRVYGQPDVRYVVLASTNLARTNWTALRTNVAVGGYFDFVDETALVHPLRFYKSRSLPP